MPVYEYRCKQCGRRFEKLVKVSAKPDEIVCPKCGARRAEKAVSLIGTTIGASNSLGASCGPVS